MLQRLKESLSEHGYSFFLPADDYITFIDPEQKTLTIQWQGGVFWLYIGNKPVSNKMLHASRDLQDLLDFLLI